MAKAIKHEVKQLFPLPYLDRIDWDGRPQAARLNIHTSKGYRGGVESCANVEFVGQGCVSIEIPGDFWVTIQHDIDARATKAAVERQHASVFTHDAVQQIQVRVKAHYEAKAAAKALRQAA